MSRAADRLVLHARHAVLAAFVAGLLLGPRAPVVAVALAAVVSLASLLTANAWGWAENPATMAGKSAHPRVAWLGTAVGIAVLAGALLSVARLHALDRTALGSWSGHAADVTAIVLETPRSRSYGRVAALAQVRRGPGAGEKVLVVARRIPAAVGAEVHVHGAFAELPGYEGAARRRGAHALVRASTVIRTGGRRGGVSGVLDRIRERSDRALSHGLPRELGALARGMVLGEDAAMPEGMQDDFRAAGLTHLVAASGANVALLVAFVLAACALAGVPLAGRLAIALVAVVAYVPLAGGGPSIQRAGVMGVATIVAVLASSTPSRWYSLGLAAAATLVLNPRAAEDPGWQLSFAAVLALLSIAPALRARLAIRMPAVLADAAAVTVAATVATAPLIALHFGRVSLVSVPANLLAVPAVAPVMWIGTLAAMAGQVAPVIAAPLNAVAVWPLAFLAALSHLAAALPAAQIGFGMWPAAVVAVHLAMAALAVPAVRRWVATGWQRTTRPLGRQTRPHAGSPGPRVVAVGAAGAVAGALALGALAAHLRHGTPSPPAGLAVSALDIGQGDATLIQHGDHAILVDTGPPGSPVVAELREAGVRRLDLLVVTHAQADHEGGAAAVLDALPVGLVLDGRDGVASADGTRFARAAAEHGVRLLAPDAGQELRAGPLTLDVLSPVREDAAAHAGEDPNNRAIVAELRDGGFTMLLTADAESDVLSALALEPVDVLKVSHHGSDDPGLPALLTRLRPQAALIEVGRHNDYGHPTPSTLAALEAAGIPHVLRTDRDGTVRLTPQGGRLVVERHR